MKKIWSFFCIIALVISSCLIQNSVEAQNIPNINWAQGDTILGFATKLNALLFDDYIGTDSGNHIIGPLAVRNDIYNLGTISYNYGHINGSNEQLPSDLPYGLIQGGTYHANGSNPIVNVGDVYINGDLNPDINFSRADGSEILSGEGLNITNNGDLDNLFDDAYRYFSNLQNQLLSLASTPANITPNYNGYNKAVFDMDISNVFSIDSSAFNELNGIEFIMDDSNDALIIQVKGNDFDTINFLEPNLNIMNEAHLNKVKRVIWVFEETITEANFNFDNQFVGSILAPDLNLRFNGNGATNGTVILNSITTKAALNEVHWLPFEGNLKEQKQLHVNKEWLDYNNSFNIRPDSITIKLLYGETLVETATLSNSNGWQYTFKNLDPDKKYTIEEVDVDNYTGSVIYEDGKATLTNTVTGKPIEIIKKAYATEERLAGAVFEVYYDTDLSKDLSNNDKLLGTFTTNEDGVILSGEYPNGRYFIKEIKAPAGYELDNNIQTVVIDTNSTESYSVEFLNKLKNYKFTATKVDSDTNEKLSGVKFALYLESDGMNGLSYESDTFIANLETNNQGIISYDNLKYNGTYYLLETKALSGYQILKEPYEFKINDENETNIKFEILNTKKPDLYEAKLLKVDAADSNITLVGAEFDLFLGEEKIGSYTTDENGVIIISGLLKGNYHLVETKAPNGYELNSENIELVIDGSIEVVSITVENTKTVIPTVDFPVTKVWEDNNDELNIRPESISVELLKDGEATGETVELNANNNWTHTFKDLVEGPVYSVKEVSINDHYDVSYDEGTIINTIKLYEAKLLKVDAADSNITLVGAEFDLFLGEEKIGSYTTDENGVIIISGLLKGNYHLVETKAPNGYELNSENIELVIDGSIEVVSITVENTKTVIPTVDFPVTKVWEDNNDELNIRPESISVELLKDGEATGETVELNANNNWTHTFKDLVEGPVYSVKEVSINDHYDVSYDEGTIINTIKLYEAKLLKVDAIDNSKLAGVVFELFLGYKSLGEYTTDTNGEIKFENLLAGNYHVVEVETLEGYILNNEPIYFIVGEIDEIVTFEVENTPKLIDISVEKQWEDEDNLFGLRPEAIEVELYIDEEPSGKTYLLNEANEWKVVIKDLPVTNTYSFKEKDLDKNYKAEYSVNGTSFIVTNTLDILDPLIIKVDADDNEIRLPGAVFELYMDSNNDLVYDENDKKIGEYTTNEYGVAKTQDLPIGTYFYQEIKAPEGYILDDTMRSFVVDEDSPEVIKLFVENNKEVSTTQLSVEKVWDDNDDALGLRPTSISVELYKDGEATGNTIELNASNNWTYTFEGLEIDSKYSIREINVDSNYDVAYSFNGVNYKVINTLKTINPTLVKTDSVNTDLKLGGATFALYQDINANNKLDSEDLKLGEYTTNSNGLLSFGNLFKGTYFYQEIKAPIGYELDNKVHSFIINDQTSEIDLLVTNKHVVIDIEIPPTGDNSAMMLWMLILFLSLGLGIIVVRK